MKGFRTILTAVLMPLCFGLSAKVVTFDFAANEFGLPTTTNTSDSKGAFDEPVVKDDVKITFERGEGQISPLLWYSSYNDYIELRCYKGNSFTVASTAGAAITAIEFTNRGKLDVAGNPEGEWGGENYSTWMGNSATVDFAVNGPTQVQQIIVTLEEGVTTVATPSFSPADALLYSPTEITIACATEGATIDYAFGDGEWEEYTSPILIDEPTLLKAKARLGDAESEVAQMEFSFAECYAVASIAEFKAADTELPIRFDIPLTVQYQNLNYTYVVDAVGGAMCIYGDTGQSYRQGDAIPAGAAGRKNNYHETIQLTAIKSSFKAPAGDPVEVKPVKLGVSEVSPDHADVLVIIPGAQLLKTKNGNSWNYSITGGDATLPLFNRFKGIEFPENEGIYDITGIVSTYDATLQLYPIEFTVSSSIGSVHSDSDNAAVIYDISGRIVNDTSAGGVFLRRVGNSTTKIIVK